MSGTQERCELLASLIPDTRVTNDPTIAFGIENLPKVLKILDMCKTVSWDIDCSDMIRSYAKVARLSENDTEKCMLMYEWVNPTTFFHYDQVRLLPTFDRIVELFDPRYSEGRHYLCEFDREYHRICLIYEGTYQECLRYSLLVKSRSQVLVKDEQELSAKIGQGETWSGKIDIDLKSESCLWRPAKESEYATMVDEMFARLPKKRFYVLDMNSKTFIYRGSDEDCTTVMDLFEPKGLKNLTTVGTLKQAYLKLYGFAPGNLEKDLLDYLIRKIRRAEDECQRKRECIDYLREVADEVEVIRKHGLPELDVIGVRERYMRYVHGFCIDNAPECDE